MSGDVVPYEELIGRLRAIADTGRTLGAAQVRPINLDAIRNSVGAHWPIVRHRIRAGSMNFLNGCVNADDVVIPCGDGFLVLFANSEGENLDARSQVIQDLLTAFYVGEEGLEALSAKATPTRLDSAAIRAVATSATRPERAPPAVTAGHDLTFLPVWSSSAQVVVAHVCGPTYCDDGVVRHGYGSQFRAAGRQHLDACEHVDLAALDATARAAHDLLAQQVRGALLASVHLSTLRRATAVADYVRGLGAIPAEVRARMIVHIAEIEPGTPSSTLEAAVGVIRPLVSRVSLQYHHTQRGLPALGEIGPWAVGYEAPPHSARVDMSTLRCIADAMKAWASAARRQRLRSFVTGLRHQALVEAARRAPIDFVSGEAFWPPVRTPGDAHAAEPTHMEI